jgi:acyl-coenzyme A synthetase/AMP-(fatty) acid ligase
MNVLQPFFTGARAQSTRAAIIEADGASVSFADLVRLSGQLAAAWRGRSVAHGDRVLVAMPLGILLYASVMALWRLGAVIVFPEPALGLKGLRHAVVATAPKAFLASGWFRALRVICPELWSVSLVIAPERGADTDVVEPVCSNHPALISFTSGSTGRPKAIVRNHGFLAHQNACLANLLKPSRDDETDLVAFPVFVLANLGFGVTSVLPNWNLRRQETADAGRIAAHVATHAVTRILAPPSICEKLASGPTLDHLDAVFTGGGPVFPDLLARLAEKAPRADIVSVYGSTEAEPIAYQHLRDVTAADWQAMQGGAGLLAGPPVAEIEMKITNDEIIVTGDHVNKGYLDPADDRTTKLVQDGKTWHRTGDAGRVDESGRLWLLGRLDGRAGDLFPFRIEVAARFWPGVRRVALVSIDGKPLLAIEGDAAASTQWQRQADRFGDLHVVAVKTIPLDRRHRSKVDYPAVTKMLRGVAHAKAPR